MNSSSTFDYLIIGGGAAGCIVARSLADRLPDMQIALLESGKSDENDPSANFLSRLDEQGDDYDWGFHALATNRSNHKMAYSRARILGGCANHNDCAFIAPPEYDLERWQKAGAKGWDYQTLEPVLQRIEERLHIEDHMAGNALSRAFIDANIEMGLAEQNFREPLMEGTGWFPLNVKNDLRQSSSVVYLHPFNNLPKNLHVKTSTTVSRLLTNNHRVRGVSSNQGDFYARAETILCAGSIGTPQLLMVSGIGPGEHLQNLDIPVLTDLPGVGQNLMDHVAANISCELKRPPPAWRLTPCESTALIKVNPKAELPDVLFHFVLRLREKYMDHEQFCNVNHGVKISPNVARPKSRGSISLTSSNLGDAPNINLNYFSDEEGYDKRTLIEGLRYGRRLANSKALSPFLKQEITPGSDIVSDDELSAYVDQTCETVYHPCGTCAIGEENSPATVVTSDLKVRGVQGLRVADASVFPEMVTVNICNAVMMVAERSVDLICADSL